MTFAEADFETQMQFQIKKIGPGSSDYSSVWNPYTQEAMIRMTLITGYIHKSLSDKTLNFASAEKVELGVVEDPLLTKGCWKVVRWSFEYEPSLNEHLMYAVLKGAGCERLAMRLNSMRTRWKFEGLSDAYFLPIDIMIDVRP